MLPFIFIFNLIESKLVSVTPVKKFADMINIIFFQRNCFINVMYRIGDSPGTSLISEAVL